MSAHASRRDRCPLCAIAQGSEASCVVAPPNGAIALLSLGQVATNYGGLLVVPKSHVKSLLDAPEEALAECMTLSKRVAQALVASLGCEGATRSPASVSAGAAR